MRALNYILFFCSIAFANEIGLSQMATYFNSGGHYLPHTRELLRTMSTLELEMVLSGTSEHENFDMIKAVMLDVLYGRYRYRDLKKAEKRINEIASGKRSPGNWIPLLVGRSPNPYLVRQIKRIAQLPERSSGQDASIEQAQFEAILYLTDRAVHRASVARNDEEMGYRASEARDMSYITSESIEAIQFEGMLPLFKKYFNSSANLRLQDSVFLYYARRVTNEQELQLLMAMSNRHDFRELAVAELGIANREILNRIGQGLEASALAGLTYLLSRQANWRLYGDNEILVRTESHRVMPDTRGGFERFTDAMEGRDYLYTQSMRASHTESSSYEREVRMESGDAMLLHLPYVVSFTDSRQVEALDMLWRSIQDLGDSYESVLPEIAFATTSEGFQNFKAKLESAKAAHSCARATRAAARGLGE